MAISVTHLDTKVGSGFSLLSNTVSPSASKLIIATVVNYRTGSGNFTIETPTVTGLGLTWVQIGTAVMGTGTSGTTSRQRITCFRAMGAPSSGKATASFGGSQTASAIIIQEMSGVVTSGVSGADAVTNVVTGATTPIADPTVGSSSKTLTLAAFSCDENGAYSAWSTWYNNSAINPDSGWSEAVEYGDVNIGGIETQYRATNDTTASASLVVLGSTLWAGVAFEAVVNIPVNGICEATVVPGANTPASWTVNLDMGNQLVQTTPPRLEALVSGPVPQVVLA